MVTKSRWQEYRPEIKPVQTVLNPQGPPAASQWDSYMAGLSEVTTSQNQTIQHLKISYGTPKDIAVLWNHMQRRWGTLHQWKDAVKMTQWTLKQAISVLWTPNRNRSEDWPEKCQSRRPGVKTLGCGWKLWGKKLVSKPRSWNFVTQLLYWNFRAVQ